MTADKIKRSLHMIEAELRLIRETHLLRIIRNKRLPLSDRYVALCCYEHATPIDFNDASMIARVNQFLIADSKGAK